MRVASLAVDSYFNLIMWKKQTYYKPLIGK